jgi:hypothetical protein
VPSLGDSAEAGPASSAMGIPIKKAGAHQTHSACRTTWPVTTRPLAPSAIRMHELEGN